MALAQRAWPHCVLTRSTLQAALKASLECIKVEIRETKFTGTEERQFCACHAPRSVR